jgi:hypothetical protein
MQEWDSQTWILYTFFEWSPMGVLRSTGKTETPSEEDEMACMLGYDCSHLAQ